MVGHREVFIVMMRMNSARSPALTPQEAAMLPAQPTNLVMPRRAEDFVPVEAAQQAEAAAQARPGRLLMPGREADFVPVAQEVQRQVSQTRRGSAAGRAILHAAGVSMPGVGPMSRGW